MNKIIPSKNINNSYQPSPTLYYDIKGKVTQNTGKEIKLEKELDSKVIEYTVRVKKEMDFSLGDEVLIEAEDIQDVRAEEKDKEKTQDIGKILRQLGLEYSSENILMIDSLVSLGIKPTASNIRSYKESQELLGKIIENSDTEKLVKILDEDIDFTDLSLSRLNEELESLEKEDNFKLRNIFIPKKEMTYKEAEEATREIYGQKMGKDIYDIVIELDRKDIKPTRTKIDEILDLKSKIKSLEKVQTKDFIKIIKEEADFSIENIFRSINNYSLGGIKVSQKAEVFESFNLTQEADYNSIVILLEELDLGLTEENIELARNFILEDLNLTSKNYTRFLEMKKDLKDLGDLITDGKIISMKEEKVDILNEDIGDLLDYIKLGELDLASLGENINSLEKISDRDLLKIIKDSRDFNLANLLELEEEMGDIKAISLDLKVLSRSKEIWNDFNTIGPNPTLDRLYLDKSIDEISLKDLADKSILTGQERFSSPLDRPSENFIFNEYIKAREALTTSIVRESIIDRKNLRELPLVKLNTYILEKTDRYREVYNWNNKLESIGENKEIILSLIMKNKLPMTLGELGQLNDFLLAGDGLTGLLSEVVKDRGVGRREDKIRELRDRISETIKNGSNIEKDYEGLMDLLNQEFKEKNGNESSFEKYFNLEKKLNREDNVFQLPLNMNGDYRDLSIIIPGGNEEINKDKMDFILVLNSKKLGPIDIKMKVLGRQVYLNLEGDQALKNRLDMLKEDMKSLGYNLKVGNEDEE